MLNVKDEVIDGIKASERNVIAQEDFKFVHDELFYLIKRRRTKEVIALTTVILDINPKQLPIIKKIMVDQEKRNRKPENKTNYAFFCDTLGIDPSK